MRIRNCSFSENFGINWEIMGRLIQAPLASLSVPITKECNKYIIKIKLNQIATDKFAKNSIIQ